MTCMICKGKVDVLLDLGEQPVCNRLLASRDEKEFKHPLVLGQCHPCGLVQLVHLFPLKEVELRKDLILYSEPEDHLDELASQIKNMTSKDASVLGVSFKDATLVKRLSDLGLKTHVIDPKKDLHLGGFAGPELVQEALGSKDISHLGKHDIVIARHIFEHTYDPLGFLKNLASLLKPNGRIVLEVPDCSQAFNTLDYSIIWEEHTMYFTEDTFKASSGLDIEYFSKHYYPLEGSLVLIGKPGTRKHAGPDFTAARKFAQGFEAEKQRISKSTPDKIAFFGAGHLACVYINIFGIKPEFIMDDSPAKKGMFMPGSKVPIMGSDHLAKSGIKTCLLSINPRNESKVATKNSYFTEAGGRFLSIFPSSRFASGIVQESPEVFKNVKDIALVGDDDIKLVEEMALKSKRLRCRICAHSSEEKIHEMLISIAQGSYIRPHRHHGKSESFHVIKGEADIVLFDEKGGVIQVISLGPLGSGKKLYYRIRTPLYHTVLVRTPLFTFQEVTNGPASKEGTEYASWAPEEGTDEAKEYFKQLRDMTCTQ